MNIEGVLKTVCDIKSDELEEKVNNKLSEISNDVNKFVEEIISEFNLCYSEVCDEDQTIMIKLGMEAQLINLFNYPLTYVPDFKLDLVSKEELLVGHLIKK